MEDASFEISCGNIVHFDDYFKRYMDIVEPLDLDDGVLMEDLRQNGCEDPIKVGAIVNEDPNKLILLDGHRRIRCCRKLKIPYNVTIKRFETREEASAYVAMRQAERRNLSGRARAYVLGKMYHDTQMSWTSDLRDRLGCSRATYYRNAAYYKTITRIAMPFRRRILHECSADDAKRLAVLTWTEQAAVIKLLDDAKGFDGTPTVRKAVELWKRQNGRLRTPKGIVVSAPFADPKPILIDEVKQHAKEEIEANEPPPDLYEIAPDIMAPDEWTRVQKALNEAIKYSEELQKEHDGGIMYIAIKTYLAKSKAAFMSWKEQGQ